MIAMFKIFVIAAKNTVFHCESSWGPIVMLYGGYIIYLHSIFS